MSSMDASEARQSGEVILLGRKLLGWRAMHLGDALVTSSPFKELQSISSDSHLETAIDLRMSGSLTGDEPGWSDVRIRRWILIFLGLGIVMRLLRFWLDFPLWNDESYVALNIQERDFLGLMKPLDYGQVCPLLFLWAEKAITLSLGFSESSLRLLPTIASIANLFLFRHVAGRLLRGKALLFAVAFLAIAFSPIRYGGEVKPYATDLLMALSLIALAIESLREPRRAIYIWGLVALAPFAIAISNPSIFIVATVGLVLTIPVLKSRNKGAIAALAAFGFASLLTFLILLRWINGPQSEHVMSWMSFYWAGAFPPRSPIRLLGWLLSVHTSHMFAYPGGGDHGASSLTTGFVTAAIIAYCKRGSKVVIVLLLTPFALGLIAAAMGRYPYGGSARTMQYVAPSILLLAGLGASVLSARLPRPIWREQSPLWAMLLMMICGLGMMTWDLVYPYKTQFFQASRELARKFWSEESSNAEVICAWTDLRLPLKPLRWQQDREVSYLCNQAIYSPRHYSRKSLRLDLVTTEHPLRLVVFNETKSDAIAVAHWLQEKAGDYELRARREHLLDQEFRRGKWVATDRYIVYDLVPAGNKVASAVDLSSSRNNSASATEFAESKPIPKAPADQAKTEAQRAIGVRQSSGLVR